MAEAAKSDPSRSADVVMVACKLPHGLRLELLEAGETLQPKPGGQVYILKGANSLREDKRAALGRFDYAVTPIPRDFWDAWLKRNKDLEFVVKGFVFAETSTSRAQDKGKEHEKERTGLEALATEKDPRLLQIGRLGGPNVETDPDSLARAIAAPA